VIKTARMGIPILISCSGFSAWDLDLARQTHLTLIGRAKGRRSIAPAGAKRIIFDSDARAVEEEHPRLGRKAALAEENAA
jgi:FdhD protein